jgi:hypothetical protein
MCCVEGNTEEDPCSKDAGAFRRVFVQTKHPHHRKKQPIHDRSSSTEIVQFLRNSKIPRMKHTAKNPTREAKIAKAKIKLPEWVTSRNLLPQNFHTVIVSEKIKQRKDDGEGFLHAEEAVKGPFAVELEDWFAVGGFAGETFVGDDVLAGVVAFGGAGPEEEAVLECCVAMSLCCPSYRFTFLFFLALSRDFKGQGLQIEGPPGTQLVAVHVCETHVSWLLALRA